MGASQSVADHRFKRVASNEERARCGMCSLDVEAGEVAYRCRDVGCTFVLHDACYRRPRETKHFAHSCSGRPLTLSDKHPVAPGRRCDICAAPFNAGAFVYGCRRCNGFYVHPRCCGLPKTVRNTLHTQHALTLLAPPLAGAGGRRRTCLNTKGNCNNARARRNNNNNAAAWSYRCDLCTVELCLRCQLPNGGGGPAVRQHGCCGGPRPRNHGGGGAAAGNYDGNLTPRVWLRMHWNSNGAARAAAGGLLIIIISRRRRFYLHLM
ncbi:hypothetical protein PAHAL_6G282000 [Panicum hallii]|jgi:hypothetical protein|uniref:DC1 domain-containing protein n=2 Tax=Panicum hallii TaxID=206008 RepID=A0A2T8IHW7_9POAL|nr:hypothetical protein PAHAL_6G282000 [Panicum hallii]